MSTISLRPLLLSDSENIVRWRNSPEVKSHLYSQDDITIEQHIHYFNKYVLTEKIHQFVILNCDDDVETAIGTTFLKNIDLRNKNAEFGIFIGDDSHRGKGYSIPAVIQTLEYGFWKLHLHRIYLSVMADNIPAIASYNTVGFIQEGVFRDTYNRNGKYINTVFMGILEAEFNKRYGNK